MEMTKHPKEKKIAKKFVPFVAGVGCGITISVIFCLAIAMVVGELGLSTKKLNRFELQSQTLLILADDVTKEAPAVPDPDWKAKLNPSHIPATLQQEIGLKKEVFVAVLASNNANLDTLSLNQETWVKELDNFDVSFSIYTPMEEDGETVQNFVHLPDLSSANEASSQMLYHTLSDLCANHIDTHRLFFVVGAHSYVNVSGLMDIVGQLNESEELYIGRKTSYENVDRLYYNDASFHCPINPGFIVSRHTLQRLCPHISICIKEHSDQSQLHQPSLNLARCMKRFLNLNCSSSSKFHKLSADELLELTKSSVLSSYYHENEVVSTFHSSSSSLVSNLLHRHHVGRLLNETIRKNKNHLEAIDNMDKILVKTEGTPDDRLILGKRGIKNKFQHHEVIIWNRYLKNEFGSYDQLFSVEDSRAISSITRSDREALDLVTATATNYLKEQPQFNEQADYDFGDIFQRTVPGYASEYLLVMQKNGIKIGSLQMEHRYDDLVAVETSIVENVPITIVLPIQDSSKSGLLSFMQMFEQSSLSSLSDMESIELLLVVYPSNETQDVAKDLETLHLLSSYKNKHKRLSIRWIDAREHLYSYIGGIIMAISALPSNRLVCSMTTSVELSTEFFHHARANTKQGKQMYFPIPYQLSNQSESEVGGDDFASSGFWRSFDFDYFCGYQSDFMLASDMGRSPGFSSGESLYAKCMSVGLNIFRSPEPSCAVKHVQTMCSTSDWSRDEQEHCLRRQKQFQLHVSSLK